ncbi:MAG: GIY-YIG nuclease family protein [Treponema sp.]|nr:GIY-YIG nuclease family protein [Treponema sp.]
MAKCSRCGKKGFFLKLENSGVCSDCERVVKIEADIKRLETEHDKLDASYKNLKENKDRLYNEIAEKAKNEILNQFDDVCKKTSGLKDELAVLQEEKAKLEKSITSSASKLLQAKTLVKSVQYSAKRFFDSGELARDMLNESVPPEADELLSTTVKLKFNLMDIRELRKRFNQNNKLIKELLTKYQGRYTTKANMSIYQLMVIALEAELQNILYNLKYSKLDKALKDIMSMTAKYQIIATGGNQSIAPTITKFIGEIEYLFIEAVNIEYEYYIQKERIKEEQRAIREQMRQEAAERKILEEERKKIDKEEEKFKFELAEIERLIADEKDEEKIKQLEDRRKNRADELQNIEKKKDDIIKREHGLAGSVYIISNLGSFGDNVFKIGMTRRIDYEERINELGDASVPFKFDIHCVIFSENARELEFNLHKRLHDKHMNKINLRKEFFKISIDELEELVYSIEPTAEFNKTMLAEQYYQSMTVDEIPESVEIIDEDGSADSDDDGDEEE